MPYTIGNSGPFLALVGVSLASGSGILTKVFFILPYRFLIVKFSLTF